MSRKNTSLQIQIQQDGQWKMNADTNKEDTNVLELKQEPNIESDDSIERCEESRSESCCQTPLDEGLWLVRRQLCRGCHSDGAFWSLETLTEGVSYGDLLQSYLNIQLCPVSKEEAALAAICALCASRLRDAHAFSAQAHATERRFTTFYRQNRVRVLAVKCEDVIEDVTKVKIEDDDENLSGVGELVTVTLNDGNQLSDVDESETKPIKLNLDNGKELSDVGEPKTEQINSNLDGVICGDKSMSSSLLNNKKRKGRRPYTRKKNVEKPIKTETTEKSKSRKRSAKVTTTRAKKSKVVADGKKSDHEEPIDKKAPKSKKRNKKHVSEKKPVSKNGDHEEPIDEKAPKSKKRNKKHVSEKKPVSRNVYRVLPTDYEHTKGGFKCTHCGDIYNTLEIITCHIKEGHMQHSKNKPEPFQVSPTDFIFIEDSFKCSRCNSRKFTTSAQIYQHIKRLHLRPPRYTCSLCSKTFRTIVPFTKHKLEEHSIDDKIKCNACDWFSYGRKHDLIDHRNEFHMLGEKLCCPDCDYVCFSKMAMKKHMVKHSSIKEHHCKYCKKSFLRKSTLSCHEKIHTGDKRQVCNECGQAFVQRASLKYHMAKHHPEVPDQSNNFRRNSVLSKVKLDL